MCFINFTKHQRPDIDKFYLYTKDTSELKYQLLINVRGKVKITKLKKPKAFIDYL